MFGWAHELGPAKLPGPHIGVFVAMSDAVRLAELLLARAVTLRGVVPSRVAWAMAADDQAWCVTWEQISSSAGEVTSGVAHKVLEEFRKFASGETRADRTVVVRLPALDLTDGLRFDWWAYLKDHPEGERIVGRGVTKFELRFSAARDPITNQQRLDFIVHRRTAADQHPHVRLHPHRHKLKHNGRVSRKEAIPVYGFLPEWLGESYPRHRRRRGFARRPDTGQSKACSATTRHHWPKYSIDVHREIELGGEGLDRGLDTWRCFPLASLSQEQFVAGGRCL